MEQETLKLELIQWLSKLENEELLNSLKAIKDNRDSSTDWASELTTEQIDGINRGLRDLEAGKFQTHDQVKAKYGI